MSGGPALATAAAEDARARPAARVHPRRAATGALGKAPCGAELPGGAPEPRAGGVGGAAGRGRAGSAHQARHLQARARGGTHEIPTGNLI